MAAQVCCAYPACDGLEARFADRPAARLCLLVGHMGQQGGAGEDHRQRIGDVLPVERGRRAVRRLGHDRLRAVVVVEGDDERLGSRDRAEERQHEIAQNVAVAVERRNHERIAGRCEQQRERRVDELRLVGDVGVTGSRAVHLFLEHSLVHRAHGVLGAAEHLGTRARRMAEGELGDSPADSTLDALGAERKLALAFPLAPFLGPVGVADRHANHRDGRVNPSDRQHPWDAPAGADDDVAADLLAQDPVRAPHVVCALRRDRRSLEPETRLDDGSSGLVDDGVTGCPTRFEREVEAVELQRHAHDVRGKDAQGFLEQFLTRLVALKDDDGPAVHDRQSRGLRRRANHDDDSSSNRERREYRIPVGRFL